MTELLFGFKDLLNVSKPNTPILDISSLVLTDSFVRKFNPKRYNFYVKFVNGLSDPANLYKFLYTTKDSKIYHAEMQNKLEVINKSLKQLTPADKAKVIDSLKNALKSFTSSNIDDKYDDLFTALGKVTGGNDNFYIKKNPMPMKSLLTEIEQVAPLLGSVPPANINELIINSDGTQQPPIKTDIKEQLPVIKGIYEKYKNIPSFSPDRLEITIIDRVIFILTTLVIRIIALALIYWGLNANLINNFKTAFIYYSAIYILFFIFIIALVNVMYYYPIFELFSNISLSSMPSLLYYFYVHINGYNRLILHLCIILILSFIPFVLSMDKRTEEQKDMNISFDYQQKDKILNSISYFSLGVWVFTSIIAIKF
jgi:hypothetical protein